MNVNNARRAYQTRTSMSTLCVNIVRGIRLCPLPKQPIRHIQAYKDGCQVLKRQFVSSGEASPKRCQRPTESFQLNDRIPIRGKYIVSHGNTRTVCFDYLNTSNITLPLQYAPVVQQHRHTFHTSSPLRALPGPLIWLVLKPLQKVIAIILGRSIRKWWAALPPNRRQLLREATWRRRWQLTAVAAAAAVIIALFLLSHLDESPVTGRTRLLVFSRENYMELAALTAEGYLEEFADHLVSEQDPRHKVVERVVQHLAQRNRDIPEVSTVPWTVHVVQSPAVNAFVLPNGKVFMFTGMLDAVADVHQLTFILGHEMAHAIIGHSAEQASLSHVVDLLSLILLTAIWAVCPRDSLALLGHWIQGKLTQLMFSRPYSRKLEAEADLVGLQLAAKACADVRAGPVFWQQMELSERLSGEPAVPEWLSTHPSHQNRVTQLDRLLPQALELREGCACPALPATDPRAVFSKSVHALLAQRGEGAAPGTLRPLPVPRSPGPLPREGVALLAPLSAVAPAAPAAPAAPPPAQPLASSVPAPLPADEKQTPPPLPRLAGVFVPPVTSSC